MSNVVERVRSCGVLLVCGEPIDSFLLMRHRNRWDLPKGHVDPGETDLECALREMEEETGIPRDVVQLDKDFQVVLEYPVLDRGERPALKSLVIFLGRLEEPHPVQLTEHIDSRWFPWQPPHRIQDKTIDPVLSAVERFLTRGQ